MHPTLMHPTPMHTAPMHTAPMHTAPMHPAPTFTADQGYLSYQDFQLLPGRQLPNGMPNSFNGVGQSASNSRDLPRGGQKPITNGSLDNIGYLGPDTSNRLPNSNHKSSLQANRSFACPFFRRSPLHFPNCSSIKTTRVREMKQHVLRKHVLPPPHCPVCCERFTSTTDFNLHLNTRSCEPREPTSLLEIDVLSSLSEEKQVLLKEPIQKNHAPIAQWYDMWDILFENASKPSNPYLGTMVEETVSIIRTFLADEGPELLREVRERSYQQFSTNEGLNALMMELLNGVRGRFEQVRGLESSPPSNNPFAAHEGSLPSPPHLSLPARQVDIDELARRTLQYGAPGPSEMMWALPENEMSSPSTTSQMSHGSPAGEYTYPADWNSYAQYFEQC